MNAPLEGSLLAKVELAPRDPILGVTEAFNADTNNFQPRIGLAYRVGQKWVLRGGYGLYYTGQNENGSTNGFSQRTNIVPTIEITFGAFVSGTWICTTSSIVKMKPSRLLATIWDKRSSSLWASLSASDQLRLKIDVGTFSAS